MFFANPVMIHASIPYHDLLLDRLYSYQVSTHEIIPVICTVGCVVYLLVDYAYIQQFNNAELFCTWALYLCNPYILFAIEV